MKHAKSVPLRKDKVKHKEKRKSRKRVYFFKDIRICQVKTRRTNRIGHILRRNCLINHAIEGKTEGRMEVTERRRRRCRQLLDDLKEKRRYWELKEEALYHILWRTRLLICYAPVVRQTTE